MGKLLCDTATVTDTLTPPLLTWKDPQPQPQPADVTESSPLTSWDDVAGLEEQQRKSLSKLQSKGVLWKPPQEAASPAPAVVFRLSHGGDVESDGNCLFSAVEKAAAVGGGGGVREMRRITVKRFEEEYENVKSEEREKIEKIIKNMYNPDIKNGWGINIVQEVKLLAKKSDRLVFDDAILQLLDIGMLRETAAETIYKERCIAVEDGPSWAKYMSISGSPDDEYDIITLQYTEEGLLSVDENREGHAAAFGDDIAIECLANEFKRELYVVQAHGSDAMVDEDNCIFFLPHRPRGEITGPPLFLFMKGTGWCGAGGDHYEPLIAHPSSLVSQEKVGFVL